MAGRLTPAERLRSAAAAGLVLVGAIAAALLLVHLVLFVVAPAVAAATGVVLPAVGWPFARVARALLWPLTRPFGVAPADASPVAVLVALAGVVVLTIVIAARARPAAANRRRGN
ncbi:MAG: hypothetical protein IT340_10245 [Chloroflexi bacterium]|nr:hypothetical protein [Chloroflexota bacterium]